MQPSQSLNQNTAAAAETGLLPNLAKLLDSVWKEFDADREAAKALLARAASLLRVEIDRRATDISPEKKTGGLAAWQVRRLNVFIEARLGQPIRLAELCAVVKLSTAHFCRAFKRAFCETPHSYVMRCRLRRAETLMLTSDFSLSDIAVRCGFSDQAHLCKRFRQYYHQSPRVWRHERTERSIGLAPSSGVDSHSRRSLA